MKAIISNAVFISNSSREWTNPETGQERIFYRALFAQNGSEPLEISIDERLFNAFDQFGTYSLDLEVTSFNGKFRCTVTGFAREDVGSYA